MTATDRTSFAVRGRSVPGSDRTAAAGGPGPVRALGPLATAVLLLGIADSMVGSYAVLFAADEVGLSPLQVGVFSSAPAVGGILVSTLLGRRFDRRPARSYTVAVTLAGAAGLALLTVTRSFPLLVLVAASLVGAVAAAFPQLFALARVVLGTGAAGRRSAPLLRSAWSLAWAVGPLIGTVLLTRAGYPTILLTAAAVLAGTAVVTLAVPAPAPAPSPAPAALDPAGPDPAAPDPADADPAAPDPAGADPAAPDPSAPEPAGADPRGPDPGGPDPGGPDPVRAGSGGPGQATPDPGGPDPGRAGSGGPTVLNAPVLLATASVALFFTAMYAGSVALPLFVTRQLHQPDSAVGLLFSACAAVEVVAALGLAAVPARVSQRLLILGGMLAFVLYFALTVVAHGLGLLLVGQVARGVAIAVVGAAGIRFFQELLAPATGCATTLFSNASTAGGLVAGVLAGAAVHSFGYTTALVLCGATAAAATATFWTATTGRAGGSGSLGG